MIDMTQDSASTCRAGILRAREALADGDIFLADAILSALEENGPSERPCRCEICGVGFWWPGELEAHRFASKHGLEEVDAEMAA